MKKELRDRTIFNGRENTSSYLSKQPLALPMYDLVQVSMLMFSLMSATFCSEKENSSGGRNTQILDLSKR